MGNSPRDSCRGAWGNSHWDSGVLVGNRPRDSGPGRNSSRDGCPGGNRPLGVVALVGNRPLGIVVLVGNSWTEVFSAGELSLELSKTCFL